MKKVSRHGSNYSKSTESFSLFRTIREICRKTCFFLSYWSILIEYRKYINWTNRRENNARDSYIGSWYNWRVEILKAESIIENWGRESQWELQKLPGKCRIPYKKYLKCWTDARAANDLRHLSLSPVNNWISRFELVQFFISFKCEA